jgi:hypothetical protein
MSAAMLLLAAAGAGQLALAPAEKYSLAHLLELGFEVKAATGDALFLQGKLGAGKPPIVVKCIGQTIAVSADQNCRRVY